MLRFASGQTLTQAGKVGESVFHVERKYQRGAFMFHVKLFNGKKAGRFTLWQVVVCQFSLVL